MRRTRRVLAGRGALHHAGRAHDLSTSPTASCSRTCTWSSTPRPACAAPGAAQLLGPPIINSLTLTSLDAHPELSTALGLCNTRCSAAAGTLRS